MISSKRSATTKPVRMSSEALLDRYAKIPQSEITACTEAISLPRLESMNVPN